MRLPKSRVATSALSLILLSASFSVLPLHAAEAKTLWEKLFGSDDENQGPPPEKTLQAPFPTTVATGTAANSALMGIYDDSKSEVKNSNSLDQPHRNPDQVAEWASGIVSQALTITPDTWDKDFEKLSVNFTPFAADEYKAYLKNANLVSALKGNEMKMQAISDGLGMITKEGAIGGTYHWLAQIPIMTSFYKANMKEVDKNGTNQNQNLIVQVQVGRIPPKSSNDMGIIVERWHVSAAK